MFRRFYPGEYINSVYEIPFESYYAQGIRGIIFDIDNTLVPHGFPADERSVFLFERLRSIGFQTCLISNNKEPRVKPFADQVGSIYEYKADKPSTKNYIRAMERMGTDRATTMFVGDQLFTDVWGANRAGIFSILVKPIDKKEEIQIVLKRYLERIVLRKYRKNDSHKALK